MPSALRGWGLPVWLWQKQLKKINRKKLNPSYPPDVKILQFFWHLPFSKYDIMRFTVAHSSISSTTQSFLTSTQFMQNPFLTLTPGDFDSLQCYCWSWAENTTVSSKTTITRLPNLAPMLSWAPQPYRLCTHLGAVYTYMCCSEPRGGGANLRAPPGLQMARL